MTDIAIRCEGLGKQYRIGERERYKTLRDTIADTVSAPFRRLKSISNPQPAARNSEFWALKDVSFEVKRGEVVGIIGRNGAGKSTLLKILSRITAPTTGEVNIHGRVGSLLEVGTGFHPELTGRENVFLNGAILGMKRVEIERKFDEIVTFAEIEKFIDTPVKRYSSGMYVRLAFAVAAHLEPDILVIDEVLAVGDLQFQNKCFGKVDEVAKSGRTVLFVSHNIGAIQSFCHNALWIDMGRIKKYGNCLRVTTSYLEGHKDVDTEGKFTLQQHLRGNREITLSSAKLFGMDGEPKSSFLIGEPFMVDFTYEAAREVTGTFWVLISSADGTFIISSFQKDTERPIRLEDAGKLSVEISDTALLPGSYFISVGAFNASNEIMDWVENGVRFDVLPHFSDGKPFDHRYGLLTKQFNWKLGM